MYLIMINRTVMDVEAFEKRISQYLKKSKEEQVLYFAWHCAVRALPFLSV